MTPQQEKIINYLSQDEYSAVDLLMRGCGSEARKHISDLRKMGYEIKDKWVKRGKSRFKKYYMEE